MRSFTWRRLVRVSGLICVSGLFGCESTVPEQGVCVTTPAQGSRLRAMTAYYSDRQLVEISDDVPFEDGQACLTFRPPQTAERPVDDWTTYIDNTFESAYPIWPLEIAIYDDLNDNQRIDPGEVRGRRDAGLSPGWLEDFERLYEIYVELDHASDLTLGLRPFIWTTHVPDSSSAGFGGEEEGRNPARIHIEPNARLDCGASYPSCLVDVDYDSVPDVHLIDPALGLTREELATAAFISSRSEVGPLVQIEGEGVCAVYPEFIQAQYRYETAQSTGDCACLLIRQTVNLYFPLDGVPDWVNCTALTDPYDDIIVGLQAAPSTGATGSARSSE